MLALSRNILHGDYPRHCSPCLLVAKPNSAAMRLVVDYGEVNKKTQKQSGSVANMEDTIQRIAKCRFKTEMDKRSGFWQENLTQAAQEPFAFVTPKGHVFCPKVMPFGVGNAPALFHELMNKILLRRLKLQGENLPKSACQHHLGKIVVWGARKQVDTKLSQKFIT